MGLNWRANLPEAGSGQRDEWDSLIILSWKDWVRDGLITPTIGAKPNLQCSPGPCSSRL